MQRVAVWERRALRGKLYHLLITFQWREHLVTQEPGKTKMGEGREKNKPTRCKLLEVSLNIFFGHGKSFVCGTAWTPSPLIPFHWSRPD